MWIVSAVLLKVSFKEYLQKTFTYSYDVYGMFWGTSTTAVVFFGGLCGITTVASFAHFTNIKIMNVPGRSGLYVLFVALLVILVLELSVAIYTATRSTVAVPTIFKYPTTLLCCGRKRRAECFVTTLVLWVDLVTLQLVLLQASLIMFAHCICHFCCTLCSNHQCDVGCASSHLSYQHLLTALYHICPPLYSC